MTRHSILRPQDFFLTAPSPCPYLPGRVERKVFTQLSGPETGAINETMNRSGFRRSQNIAYRPVCEDCTSCVSVRVVAGDFSATDSLRRIVRRNRDLVSSVVLPQASGEQYELFRRYLGSRHRGGGMDGMEPEDFADMVECCPPQTRLVEYRRRPKSQPGNEHMPKSGHMNGGGAGDLIAACIVDRFGDGFSLIYSFFRPEESRRSLGHYMILDQIQRARRLGLPYVYLGYWIRESSKMAYKARFGPLEGFVVDRWIPFAPELAAQAGQAAAGRLRAGPETL